MSADRRRDFWRGDVLARHGHVCGFYHGQEDEYRLTLPFLKEGFEQGHKCVLIVDDNDLPTYVRWLEEVGVGVSGKEGPIEVRGWESAHLRTGAFDQEAMLSLVEEVLTRTKREGFRFTRWVADMGWALREARSADQLIEYCARLQFLVPKYDASLVCTYSCNDFGASVVVNALRCHPVAVVGGILHENPFFVPPEELLQELRHETVSPPQ